MELQDADCDSCAVKRPDRCLASQNRGISISVQILKIECYTETYVKKGGACMHVCDCTHTQSSLLRHTLPSVRIRLHT